MSTIKTSPEKEVPDSDLSERYLTPTEETDKISEEIDNKEIVIINVQSDITQNSKELDLNVSVSDNQTDNKISEAVPIVENSAVSVEIEPSNVDSSLEASNIPIESVNDDSKDNGTEESEVPAVENIPTISQICDPSHYGDVAAVTENVLNDNNPETPIKEEAKRRVSLPSNHLEQAVSDDVKEIINHQVSPQKRPRSASTSTQVDPNHFGRF